MQALPSGHLITDLPTTFPCAQCGTTIHHKHPAEVNALDYSPIDTPANGYAVRTSDNALICYECAAKSDIADAAQTGKLFAYVKGIAAHRGHTSTYYRQPRYYVTTAADVAITTWPGLPLNVGPVHADSAYVSNFGDVRIPIRALLPTANLTTSAHTWNGHTGDLETWHGTYYASAGDYARLTRDKHQTNRRVG